MKVHDPVSFLTFYTQAFLAKEGPPTRVCACPWDSIREEEGEGWRGGGGRGDSCWARVEEGEWTETKRSLKDKNNQAHL